MKTRSKRAQQEQEGVPPTPPQALPTARTSRAKRATRSTTSPDIQSDNSDQSHLHPPSGTKASRPLRVTKSKGRPRKGNNVASEKLAKHLETVPELEVGSAVVSVEATIQPNQREIHNFHKSAPQFVHVVPPKDSKLHSSVAMESKIHRQIYEGPGSLTSVASGTAPTSQIPAWTCATKTGGDQDHEHLLASSPLSSLGSTPDSPRPMNPTTDFKIDDCGLPASSPSMATFSPFSDPSIMHLYDYQTPCPPRGNVLHCASRPCDMPSSPVKCATPPALENFPHTMLDLEHSSVVYFNVTAMVQDLNEQYPADASLCEADSPPSTPYQTPSCAFKDIVYNWPKSDEHAFEKCTVLNLLVNEQILQFAESSPRNPLLSLALPTEMLPNLFAFISHHPCARGTPLERLQTDYPIARKVLEELTNNGLVGVSPIDTVNRSSAPITFDNNTRSSHTDSSPHQSSEKAITTPMRPRRNARITAATREALQENQQHVNYQRTQLHQPATQDAKPIQTLVRPYDEKGMLNLEAPKESSKYNGDPDDDEDEFSGGWDVPDDLKDTSGFLSVSKRSEDSPNSTNRKDAETLAQAVSLEAENVIQATPRMSGWAISNYLPSARLVTKLIPSLNFRSQTKTPRQARLLEESAMIETPTQGRTSGEAPNTAPSKKFEQHQHIGEKRSVSTAEPSRRFRDSLPKHQLQTKGEKDIIRRQKEEIKRLREQLKMRPSNKSKSATASDADSTDSHSTSARNADATSSTIMRQARQSAMKGAALETEQIARQRKEEVEEKEKQTLGAKRKRSLDTIPNPSGGGYGMDLQYFGLDSDEDTILQQAQTPSQKPSTKKIRLSTPESQLIGNPRQATPYTGSLFALSNESTPRPYPQGNTFSAQDVDAPLSESADSSPSTTTPIGPTMIFTVPSPSDSDDEFDGPSYADSSIDKTKLKRSPKSSPTSKPSPTKTNSNIFASQPAMNNFSRPNDAASAATPEVPVGKPEQSTLSTSKQGPTALDKARQTALKHQPMQPSRLREASRLSTSTIASASDADEVPWEARSEFSSFKHYQQLIPDKVTSAISDHGTKFAGSKDKLSADFARWDRTHEKPTTYSQIPSQNAGLGGLEKSGVIDKVVLDHIEQAWMNQKEAPRAIKSFAKSFSPWLEMANQEAAVEGHRIPDHEDGEAPIQFGKDLSKWMESEKRSAQQKVTALLS